MNSDRKALTLLGIRMRNTDVISIHRLIIRGMTYPACRRVMDILDLTPSEMAGALGISQRELAMLEKSTGRLGLVPSDRLYRIARILILTIELFRRKKEAVSWLRSPQLAFGGTTPFELLLSEPGSQEVKNLLVRIAHGVFS